MSPLAPGSRVTVHVPATSANLGPGYDALGLALDLWDEVTLEMADDAGLHVEVTGEGAADVPRDASHLVVRALDAGLRAAGGVDADRPGLVLRATNRIPHGRGLGSSAAAVVAGLLLARGLAGRPLPDDVVLDLATQLEGHPDNAAACLLGGVTVAWRGEDGQAQAVRVPHAPGLRALALVPHTALATSVARSVLPGSVPHADAAHNVGRAALLMVALGTRPDLLFAATEDRLHQNYRGSAMPESAELLGRLRRHGHAAVLSGAGPALLVLAGDDAGDAPLVRLLSDQLPAGWRLWPLAVADRARLTRWS